MDDTERLLSIAREKTQTTDHGNSEEIEDLRLKLESYYELYANTRSNRDAIKIKIDKCESELDILITKYEEESMSIDDLKKRIMDNLKEYNSLYKGYLKSGNTKESDIASMITKIVVGQKNKKHEFTITFKVYDDMEIVIGDDSENEFAGKSILDQSKIRLIVREAENFIYGNV